MLATFSSVTELETVLRRSAVDVSSWGKGSAKTPADLWHELHGGESVLELYPLLRSVRAVQVLIRRGKLVLIEVNQTLRDGRIRVRNRLPSERMLRDETPYAAARRCVLEELPVAHPDRIRIAEQRVRVRSELIDSPSYPGLKTLYKFSLVEAQVDGLPDRTFDTREVTAGRNDPVVAHQWRWLSCSPDNMRDFGWSALLPTLALNN